MKVAVAPVDPAQVKALRAFNRFYTQRIGVLAPYLGSELSLTEVRVLYELAHRLHPTASELVRDLSLDAGYLSRILRRFATQGWLDRARSPEDGRQSLLELTDIGHDAFAPLQQRSREEAAALLAGLPALERKRLMESVLTVHRLLDPTRAADRTALLRDLRPGDMGWVVMQHGEIYAAEYGFDWEFESLVAEVAAAFIKNFKPTHERGWIAEIDGERVGSAFVVQKSATVAQLRLLILTATARGHGLGGRMVDECIAFARRTRYRKLRLWTQDHLDAARATYRSRGFKLTSSEPFRGYGRDLMGETWELRL